MLSPSLYEDDECYTVGIQLRAKQIMETGALFEHRSIRTFGSF